MSYNISVKLDFKRNQHKGKFIVLEGVEASGKTTQIRKLEKALLADKKKVFITKNPTDGVIGKFIRNQILAGNKIKLDPIAFQYLFVADRVMQEKEIIKHLKKGEIVISDRYFWSSVAYGIVDRKGTKFKNWEQISPVALSLLSMYYQFLIPDVNIYLKISIKESARRIKGSAKHNEIYDDQKMSLQIRKAYGWIIKKFKKEFTIISGEQNEDKVTKDILKLIK